MECISKGKEHKKYKFGNKSAIPKTGSGLIVSALAFQGNPYDGHTLSAHREQIARLTGYEPVEALTDRGYRGKKRVGNMAISIPSSGSPGQSYYQKRKARKKFCKRAGIEPVIRMKKIMTLQNYIQEYYRLQYESFCNHVKAVVDALDNILGLNDNQVTPQQRAAVRGLKAIYSGQLINSSFPCIQKQDMDTIRTLVDDAVTLIRENPIIKKQTNYMFNLNKFISDSVTFRLAACSLPT